MRFEVLVTSCDRHDLLRQTLESLSNTLISTPTRTVILEDSEKGAPDWLPTLRDLGKIVWLSNGARMGQTYSLARLYDEAKEEYIFHCEDDWQFTERNFALPSFEILQKHPEITMVALRDDWDHPLVSDQKYNFQIAQPYWREWWGGYAWNPGLRRLSDVKKYVLPRLSPTFFQHGLNHEANLSKDLLDLGFRIAVLPNHCHHIGNDRSKAIEPLNIQPPKILIAIPACWKFEYGRWESSDSPHYNPGNEAYGKDIHVSGRNDRIAAVRDTWWRDIAPFSHHVTGKFFYGKPVPEYLDPAHVIKPGQTGQINEDLVVLDVPDDYGHLPQKTIAICQWALDHGFQYLLKLDDDTLCYVERAVRECIQYRFDYAGYCHHFSCTGGPGYWLSARAMRLVADSGSPQHWAEDMNVGVVMDANRVRPTHLECHRPGFSDHWFWPKEFDATKLDEQIVTAHAVQPEMMRKWWEYKNGH
jgi:hypothetical protein